MQSENKTITFIFFLVIFYVIYKLRVETTSGKQSSNIEKMMVVNNKNKTHGKYEKRNRCDKCDKCNKCNKCDNCNKKYNSVEKYAYYPEYEYDDLWYGKTPFVWNNGTRRPYWWGYPDYSRVHRWFYDTYRHLY
jgi:hypothetical protein